MKLTPLDIQQQQFKIRFRGFDIREVDTFLEQTADVIEVLRRENEDLHAEVSRIKLECQGYQEREETFKRAMLNSQTVLEQMEQNAQKAAELVIADAEMKAEKILNRAHNRLAQLHEDIAELKRQRIQIEVQIRSILEGHTKLLDIGTQETKTMDEEDAKLRVLKQP
jgi:cell division initiation protein